MHRERPHRPPAARGDAGGGGVPGVARRAAVAAVPRRVFLPIADGYVFVRTDATLSCFAARRP